MPIRGPAAVVVALTAIVLAGCGASGHGAEASRERESDVGILNAALGRELTAADAYSRGLPLLRGPFRAVGREFRAQAQEYADALTKAIRGLGGETDAVTEKIDLSGVAGQAAFLALAYRLESAALASYLKAAPHLYMTAPRALDASLAAGHAQHLVLLRRGLGASLAASVPKAFGSGDLPPPGSVAPSGRE